MDATSTNTFALVAQLVAAVGFPWILQKAKSCPRIPFVRSDTDGLNRTLSAVFAFFTAAGFHLTLDGTLHGGGEITLRFPELAHMLDAGLRFVLSIVVQQATYRTIVKPGK